MRVKTGIKGFDELIQGGLPEGSTVVLEGPSGVEKDYFASTFIAEGLKDGGAILVVLSSKPPATFFEELRAKGYDPDKLFKEGRLRVVDWYSQREESVVELEEAGPVIKVSLDLLNVGIAITRAIASLAKDKPRRAVVEILSPALSVYDLSQVHTFAQATKAKLSRQNLTSIFLVEKEMHDSTTLSTLLQPFDGVIEMDRVREGDKIVRKLAVLSLKGTAAQSDYVPFEVTKEGELTVGRATGTEREGEKQGLAPERSRDSYLWFSLGRALYQSGRHEKALVALESCVKIDPKNADALNLIAESLEKLGRKKEAEKARLDAIAAKSAAAQRTEAAPKPLQRPSRVFRILETSESRLKENPNDVDALFAKATALAALERYDDSMKALNELTKINHKYPGLWLLKSKIYADMGDAQKAKLCRDRSQQIEDEIAAEEEVVKEVSQLACPLCSAPVKEGATACPSCGIPFMTGEAEQRPAPAPPARPDSRPEPKPEISKVAPSPPQKRKVSKEVVVSTPKGRTNGLTNGLGKGKGLTNGLRGRTNGLTNGLRGRTNGLRGRTNGLTNGLRGRTNGRTNGLRGRTNGLTNGMRGRTNGLTNGLRGRTNGLTNGMRGRTNGLVNGVRQGMGKVNGLTIQGRVEGVTNGLVNGLRDLRSGITNGLTNGNGFTNGLGSNRFRRQAKFYRWKLYIVPFMAVVLLMIPVLIPGSIRTTSYVIEIDGSFGDWSSQRVISLRTDSGVSPNVRINRAGVVDNLDYLAFYVEVEGSMLQGGPDPQRLMDAVRIFLDTDGDASTGYLVKGLGAEFMVEIWGWGGTSQLAKLSSYALGASSQDNWGSWEQAAGLYAAVSANRLETEVPWQALMEHESIPVAALFQAMSWDGQQQFSENVLSNMPGLLKISEKSLATATVSGTSIPLLAVDLTSIEGDFSLTDLRVLIVGTAPLSDVTMLRLLDSTTTVLDSRVPASRLVSFHPLQPIRVTNGNLVTLTVAADTSLSDGKTLGLNLPMDDVVSPTRASGGPWAITRLNLTATYPLGYLGFVPTGRVIDGGFEDWTNPETDSIGESSTQGVDGLDIASFDANISGSAYFYLRLQGRALEGIATPQPSIPAPNTTTPTVADTDRDTVPDTVDLFPFDFNNDGTPDVDSNHDIDGDSLIDYPFGTDQWLNTTIPANFSVTYAGRTVSLYIGPTMRPPVNGEDSARFFVDVDNSTATGFSVGDIGADYMVELRGREGRVTSSGVWRYSGATQSQWTWTLAGPASYALEHDRIEVSGSIAGLNSDSRVSWATTDWRGSAGDIAQSSRRGTRGLFADGTVMGEAGEVDTYLDDAGRLQIADLKFARTEGPFAYSMEKNGVAVYFSAGSDGDEFSLLSRGDLQFSWKPLEIGAIVGGRFVETQTLGAVNASITGSRIEYNEIFPFTDDRYTISLNRVKHDIILQSVSAVPAAGETLTVLGKVRMSNNTVFAVGGVVQHGDFVTSGDIQVVSAAGITMTLQVPFAHEERDKEIRVDGSFRVQKADDGWLLSMEAPLKWFLSEKRSYPVIFDPTGIVDTSSSTGPTVYHNARKIFHDGTYFWMFYYDGANTVYEYSSDGMSWVNARTQAFTTLAVQYASVWYYDSGTSKDVYVAGDLSGVGKDCYVRKGTISGTSIGWGTEVKPVMSTNTLGMKVPSIIRASNGYIWLSAINKTGSNAYSLTVARSSATDDVSTWILHTNMFTSISTTYIGGSLVPLTGGDIYAVWYADGSVAGKKYTWASSSWGSAESIDTISSTSLSLTPSAVADSSGYVNIVYIASSGNTIYRQRTTSWSAATTLDSNSANLYATISRETSSGDLYAFWKQSTNQIAAKKYSGSAWSSITIETSTISKSSITSIYEVSGESKISWAWTDAPFTTRDVRFSMMSTTVVSVTVDTSTSSTPTMYSHQRRVLYDGSYFWAFYGDGTHTYYTYSSTGETWMNGYTQLFTTSGVRFTSVWYYSSGSTKIVYAVGDDGGSDRTVIVRRGSISGTTITWGSDTTVTVSTKLVAYKVAFICRDTSGYIWIASSGQETNFNFAAIRSTNTDDVSAWGTATPLMAADIANNYNYGVIVPLGSGDVYAVWYADGTIYGRQYSAANTTWWTSIKTINTTSAGVSTQGPSVVVDSSYNINLVFSDSTGRVIYRQRTTSWGTATVVTTTTNNVYPSITLLSSDLYVFWIDSSSQIIGKKYSGGSWSSISGIDTSTITKNYLTTIYSASDTGSVCWLWGQGSGSGAYETKFSVIPEFGDMVVLVAGVGIFLPILGRWRKERRRTAKN